MYTFYFVAPNVTFDCCVDRCFRYTVYVCVCVSERRDASRLKQSASAPHHPTFANIYAPNLPSYLAKNGEEKRPASRRDDDDAVRCTAS